MSFMHISTKNLKHDEENSGGFISGWERGWAVQNGLFTILCLHLENFKIENCDPSMWIQKEIYVELRRVAGTFQGAALVGRRRAVKTSALERIFGEYRYVRLDVRANAEVAEMRLREFNNANPPLVLLPEPYFHSLGKRLVKDARLFFTDTGLGDYLMGFSGEDALWESKEAGALWKTHMANRLVRWRDWTSLPLGCGAGEISEKTGWTWRWRWIGS